MTEEKEQGAAEEQDATSTSEGTAPETEQSVVNTTLDTASAIDEATEIEVEGPSREQIEQWKEKHGLLQMATVAGQIFIYCQMNRETHNGMLKGGLLEDENSDVNLIKAMLLFPAFDDVEWENAAGLRSTLSQNILLFAGFGNVAEPITL